MRAIPYRPLLFTVLANVAVYTLVLLALRMVLIGPLRPARQLLRLQRGHCPRCGYDLRYNFQAGCSECGFLRER